MFAKGSRYDGLDTVTGTDALGREVQAVKRRRLPQTAGRDTRVSDATQLDVLSEGLYRDATRYWHIADANTELEANALLQPAGRVIKVPER